MPPCIFFEIRIFRQLRAGKWDFSLPAAPLDAAPLTGVLDQHPAHRLGGGHVEMRSVLPGDLLGADETEVGLVDQGGRLQRVVTPLLRHLLPGRRPELIVDQRQELIGQLKRYLMYGLTLYSALLETNSYHIAVNDHLVIARFVGLRDAFDVKLYTLRPEDLPVRYQDKIYLGRDVLRLDRLQRDHFGLQDIRRVLREQTEKLRRRLDEQRDRGDPGWGHDHCR